MLVVLDDINLIDGIDGDVARGLRVVAAQGILPLDVELIDRRTLILYPSILLDLYPGELLDDILEVAVSLACEGLDAVAERVAPHGDGACLDMHLTYRRRRGLETHGEAISRELADA